LALECRIDVEGRFRFQLFNNELTDLSLVGNHSQMERAEIYQLKRDLAVESCVDGGSGQMLVGSGIASASDGEPRRKSPYAAAILPGATGAV